MKRAKSSLELDSVSPSADNAVSARVSTLEFKNRALTETVAALDREMMVMAAKMVELQDKMKEMAIHQATPADVCSSEQDDPDGESQSLSAVGSTLDMNVPRRQWPSGSLTRPTETDWQTYR